MIKVEDNEREGKCTLMNGSPVTIAAEICCVIEGFRRSLKKREKETGLPLGKVLFDALIMQVNDIKWEEDDEDGNDDEAEGSDGMVETPAGLYRWLRSQRSGWMQSVSDESGSLGD